MFFRGALFQLNGHGGCNLLPAQNHSNNSADLSPWGSATRTNPFLSSFRACVLPQCCEKQCLHGSSDCDPFALRRAAFPTTGPEMSLYDRLQPAQCRLAHCDLSLGKRLKQNHQPTRQDPALGRRSGSPLAPRRRVYKGLVRCARASDLCQASIGESYSVS
jgi:hypothetical protein